MKKTEIELPDYTFICPVCREFDLALVESGGQVYTQIIEISWRGGIMWGDPEPEPDTAMESWYACMRCGYKIEIDGEIIPGDNFDLLLKWLQDNNGSRALYADPWESELLDRAEAIENLEPVAHTKKYSSGTSRNILVPDCDLSMLSLL